MQIEVMHHDEPEGWWAEVPKHPSLFAVGQSFAETKERINDALPSVVGDDGFTVLHIIQRVETSEPSSPTGSIKPAATGLRATKGEVARTY